VNEAKNPIVVAYKTPMCSINAAAEKIFGESPEEPSS
jgi:hypothetical protein